MNEPESPNPARKNRRQKVFAVLPTLLTLGNAVCGFGAITITARVGPENYQGAELFLAAQLIFLAMVFDMLDGSAARLTNQTSDFGAQLDSLCDAISFGVAPAFLMLKLTYPEHHLMDSVAVAPFEYNKRLLWAIGVLFMLCAILRLARFNVESDDDDSHDHFSGLPSPAAAGVIASFPIGLNGLKDLLAEPAATTGTVQAFGTNWGRTTAEFVLPTLSILLPLITLVTAMMMVSRIRYPHVFNQFVRGHRSRTQLLQMVFALVLLFVVKEMAVPLVFCYFALSAPCRAVWQRHLRSLVSRGGDAVRSS